MKNQKGITLIALVVTIVVLLILAGTSIAMLTGENGIITRAQNSNYANTEGEVRDKIELAYGSVNTEVRVKIATEMKYDASSDTNIDAFVSMIEDELEIPDSGENKTGYTVEANKTSSPKTIKITYTDSIFKTGGKFAPIEYTIEFATDKATLTVPDRQVD